MRLGTLASFDTSATSAAARKYLERDDDHEHHRDDEFSHDENDQAAGLDRLDRAALTRIAARIAGRTMLTRRTLRLRCVLGVL